MSRLNLSKRRFHRPKIYRLRSTQKRRVPKLWHRTISFHWLLAKRAKMSDWLPNLPAIKSISAVKAACQKKWRLRSKRPKKRLKRRSERLKKKQKYQRQKKYQRLRGRERQKNQVLKAISKHLLHRVVKQFKINRRQDRKS